MDSVYPDDMPLLADCISSLKNGAPYAMTEVRMATARGSYLWCRFRATAIRDTRGTLQKISGIIINIDEEKQVMVFERGDLEFAFNFSPANSYTDLRIEGIPRGEWRTVFSTDDYCFGGQGRIAHESYKARTLDDGKVGFEIYLPARCAVVLKIEK